MTEVYLLFYQSPANLYSAEPVTPERGPSDRSSESGASAVPAVTGPQMYSSSYSESSKGGVKEVRCSNPGRTIHSGF